MKYKVQKREIHTVMVEIEAPNPADALEKVIQGEGQEVEGSQEYASTIDPFGIGYSNLYQWRIFGEGLDQLGLPVSQM